MPYVIVLQCRSWYGGDLACKKEKPAFLVKSTFRTKEFDTVAGGKGDHSARLFLIRMSFVRHIHVPKPLGEKRCAPVHWHSTLTTTTDRRTAAGSTALLLFCNPPNIRRQHIVRMPVSLVYMNLPLFPLGFPFARRLSNLDLSLAVSCRRIASMSCSGGENVSRFVQIILSLYRICQNSLRRSSRAT